MSDVTMCPTCEQRTRSRGTLFRGCSARRMKMHARRHQRSHDAVAFTSVAQCHAQDVMR